MAGALPPGEMEDFSQKIRDRIPNMLLSRDFTGFAGFCSLI